MTTRNSSSQHNSNFDVTGVPYPTGVTGDQGNQQATTAPVNEEERKRIRRERNRIAATRCRDKRRERTASLVQETEELENQNEDLLKDIEVLESQQKKLENILNTHLPICTSEVLKSSRPKHDKPATSTS